MKKRYVVLGIGIIAILLGIYGIYSWRGSPLEYDEFAKCLTEKGIKKYGTDWCKYCQEQKAMFGKSFEYVSYVNCDLNKGECGAAGVQGYPTWEINGELYPGVQPIERLSQLSGCEL